MPARSPLPHTPASSPPETIPSAPALQTGRACAQCASPGRFRCSRCGAAYCSERCRAAHWPAHRRACRLAAVRAALGSHGVSPGAIAEAAALVEHPAAETYTIAPGRWQSGPLGERRGRRGLRSVRDAPAGTCVGFFVGPLLASPDDALQPFTRGGVVADIAGRKVLPSAANAAYVGDSMPPAAYACLLDRGPVAFIKEFPPQTRGGNTAFERLPTPAGAWGVFRAVTTRAVVAGEPFESAYGDAYWLEMVASGVLSGTAFSAAWEANRIIARGWPAAVEPLARLAVPGGGGALQTGVPAWLRAQGVEVVYCGAPRAGSPPDGPLSVRGYVEWEGYRVAPWARELLADDGDFEERAVQAICEGIVSAVLTARGLSRRLGLAGAGARARQKALKLIIRDLSEAARYGGRPAPFNVRFTAAVIIDSPDKVDGLVAQVRAG